PNERLGAVVFLHGNGGELPGMPPARGGPPQGGAGGIPSPAPRLRGLGGGGGGGARPGPAAAPAPGARAPRAAPPPRAPPRGGGAHPVGPGRPRALSGLDLRLADHAPRRAGQPRV